MTVKVPQCLHCSCHQAQRARFAQATTAQQTPANETLSHRSSFQLSFVFFLLLLTVVGIQLALESCLAQMRHARFCNEQQQEQLHSNGSGSRTMKHIHRCFSCITVAVCRCVGVEWTNENQTAKQQRREALRKWSAGRHSQRPKVST